MTETGIFVDIVLTYCNTKSIIMYVMEEYSYGQDGKTTKRKS